MYRYKRTIGGEVRIGRAKKLGLSRIAKDSRDRIEEWSQVTVFH